MAKLGVLLIIFCSCARASADFSSVEEFMKAASTTNKFKVVAVAEGDLNGDGLNDKAILAQTSIEGDAFLSPIVFILLQTNEGAYRLAQETQLGFYAMSMVSPSLEIKKGSLYISLEAIRGEWATHQFKLINKQWRLIGLTHHIYESNPNDEGHSEGVGVDTDFNLLTGDVVINGKKKKMYGPACSLAEYDMEFMYCTSTWMTKKGELLKDLMLPHCPWC